MDSFAFIGLGLNDEKGLTLEGLEEARRADRVFAEFYTNPMPALDMKRLEKLIGKKIHVLNRTQLEEEGGRELIRSAKEDSVAFLVPGEIISAVCGATGLQSYKFSKTVTIPYDPPLPASVLETISDNHGRGLHTLLLLDVKEDQNKQLTIAEALTKITSANPSLESRLAVGVARIGARDERVKASRIGLLINEDFGGPPQSIVVVGKLHFMETEALRIICDAQDSDLRENS
ncbi:diphthine synthase [Candidatus Bathyarchaeota archaeon]|nr:MAG: diphthine synthase [Candidatus Bathyarchaeota archaeon]